MVTEDDIEEASQSIFSVRERIYADVAITIAEDNGIFTFPQESTHLNHHPARSPNVNELHSFEKWNTILDRRNRGDENLPDCHTPKVQSDSGDVNTDSMGNAMMNVEQVVLTKPTTIETMKENQSQYLNTLNEEQLMVYKIIENHLLNSDAKQLLMYLGGHGGVGKTYVINAIDDLYTHYGMRSALAKTATTGVAASNIGGSTLHSWAGLPACTPRSDTWAIHPNAEMVAQRKRNIIGKRLLIVDEISMLTTDTLADLSRILSIVLGKESSTEPLGGMSILFTGDFHQFPPVGASLSMKHEY